MPGSLLVVPFDAAVGMSLYRADAFETQRTVWVAIVRILFRMAHQHAQTRTRTKTPFVAAKKGMLTLKCRCYCTNMMAVTELGGRGDSYTAAAATECTAKTKKLNRTWV